VSSKQEVADYLSIALGRPVSPPSEGRHLAIFDGWQRTFDVWDADLPEQQCLMDKSHEAHVETFLAYADYKPIVLVFHSRKQSEGKKPRTHQLSTKERGECVTCGDKNVSADWNCAGSRPCSPFSCRE
jgi:hypothetical protein